MDKLPTKSYSPREAAEILGCEPDNVYRLIKYGKLGAFRIGGRSHYRITDIELKDFIQRMTVRNEEMKADG